MKKSLILSALFTILLLSSCASKPKFNGTGDLCGLIIDENNKPVKDFIVTCRFKGITVPSTKTAATNESGIFVFYDMPSGSYCISGEKKNYLTLSDKEYRFSDRSKILCLQTKTFKGAVNYAEELIRLGDKEAADKILEAINCDKKSPEALIILSHQFFTSKSDRERKSAASKLKRASSKEDSFISAYSQKLLEVIK